MLWKDSVLKSLPLHQYLTSTALYSDLVLPVTGVFETEGVLANHRSHWILARAKKPLTDLANRRATSKSSPNLLRASDSAMLSASPWTKYQTFSNPLNALALDELGKAVPTPYAWSMTITSQSFKDGEFKTKSKKAEFWVAAWKKGWIQSHCNLRSRRRRRAQRGRTRPEVPAL